MKGDKITVTETTCASASERFNYLACRHVNGIDGGQHGVVSTVLCHFAISSNRTFHTLSMKHMIRKHIPSSMTKIQLYSCKISRRCTTTVWLGTKCQLKQCLHICEQVFGEGSEGVYCKDGKGFSCFSSNVHTVSQRSRWQLCVRAA